MGDRYFIRENGDEPREVTLEEWIQTEKSVGIRQFSRNHPTTLGFMFMKPGGVTVQGVIAHYYDRVEEVLAQLIKLSVVTGEEK